MSLVTEALDIQLALIDQWERPTGLPYRIAEGFADAARRVDRTAGIEMRHALHGGDFTGVSCPVRERTR